MTVSGLAGPPSEGKGSEGEILLTEFDDFVEPIVEGRSGFLGKDAVLQLSYVRNA